MTRQNTAIWGLVGGLILCVIIASYMIISGKIGIGADTVQPKNLTGAPTWSTSTTTGSNGSTTISVALTTTTDPQSSYTTTSQPTTPDESSFSSSSTGTASVGSTLSPNTSYTNTPISSTSPTISATTDTTCTPVLHGEITNNDNVDSCGNPYTPTETISTTNPPTTTSPTTTNTTDIPVTSSPTATTSTPPPPGQCSENNTGSCSSLAPSCNYVGICSEGFCMVAQKKCPNGTPMSSSCNCETVISTSPTTSSTPSTNTSSTFSATTIPYSSSTTTSTPNTTQSNTTSLYTNTSSTTSISTTTPQQCSVNSDCSSSASGDTCSASVCSSGQCVSIAQDTITCAVGTYNQETCKCEKDGAITVIMISDPPVGSSDNVEVTVNNEEDIVDTSAGVVRKCQGQEPSGQDTQYVARVTNNGDGTSTVRATVPPCPEGPTQAQIAFSNGKNTDYFITPHSPNQTFRSWWFVFWFLIVPGSGIIVSLLSVPVNIAPALMVTMVNRWSLIIFVASSIMFLGGVIFALIKAYTSSRKG